MQSKNPLSNAYTLSLITGLAFAGIAIKMLRFPTVTYEPSFINCFNYIDASKGEAMFWAAIGLSAGTIWFSIKQRLETLVFIEAIMIWTVAYLLLVAVSSSGQATSPSGVMQSLVLIGACAVGGLTFVRWVLKSSNGYRP